MSCASDKLKSYCIDLFAYCLPDLYKHYHPYNLFACKYEYKNQKIQVFNDWNGLERSMYDETAFNITLSSVAPDKQGFLRVKNTKDGIHYSFIDTDQHLQQSTPLFPALEDRGLQIHSLTKINVDLSKFNKPVTYAVNLSLTKDIVDLCSAIPNLVKNKQHVEQFASKWLKQNPNFILSGSNGAMLINEYRKFKAECPDS